jgi:uncharacterized protein YcnI
LNQHKLVFATLGVAAALVAAGPAAAHGTLSPASAVAGAVQRFELTVPNDRQDADLVGIVLQLPAGAELVSAEARQPLWSVSSDAGAVTWQGGPIPRGGAETFALSLRLPPRAGVAELALLERYDDGGTPPFPLALTLTGSSSSGGTDAYGVAALVVALLALVVATAALVVVLRDRRPRPRDTPG